MTQANGHGPPTDISPGELWARLQEMPRPHRVVDFPRVDAAGNPVGKVAIWVLTQEEQMVCSAAAERFAKEKVKEGKRDGEAFESIYQRALVDEVLYRACRQSEDTSRPAYPSPQSVRQRLTVDECRCLFEHYLAVRLELGPLVAEVQPSEYEGWIERIAASDVTNSPFMLLAPDVQNALAHAMAQRIIRRETVAP